MFEKKGIIIRISGPVMSGKTTLLKLIYDLLLIERGDDESIIFADCSSSDKELIKLQKQHDIILIEEPFDE